MAERVLFEMGFLSIVFAGRSPLPGLFSVFVEIGESTALFAIGGERGFLRNSAGSCFYFVEKEGIFNGGNLHGAALLQNGVGLVSREEKKAE